MKISLIILFLAISVVAASTINVNNDNNILNLRYPKPIVLKDTLAFKTLRSLLNITHVGTEIRKFFSLIKHFAT